MSLAGAPPQGTTLKHRLSALPACYSFGVPWVRKQHPQPQFTQALPSPWGKRQLSTQALERQGTWLGRDGSPPTPAFFSEPRPGEGCCLGEATLCRVHQELGSAWPGVRGAGWNPSVRCSSAGVSKLGLPDHRLQENSFRVPYGGRGVPRRRPIH